MTWIWQQKNWPHFIYEEIPDLHEKFVHNAGILNGLRDVLEPSALQDARIDLLSEEAFRTSEIEGELLDRESVKQSVRRNVLRHEHAENPKYQRESNVAEVLVDAQNSIDEPLSCAKLCQWYATLCRGRSDLLNVSGFRTHTDAMQIVSTSTGRVYYEAPPSAQVPAEMDAFVHWFNKSRKEIQPLIRAGIAHLYFVMIHPFEDGNGRISRLLAEKALGQFLGRPPMISISAAIQKNRKKYYNALEMNDNSLKISSWLKYFAETIIEAQEDFQNIVKFTIKKTNFYRKYAEQMNDRQKKAVATIFKGGKFEFEGGMSADKYIAITKTSRATATRDLNDMVQKGIMTKTGELRYTRYWLKEE